MNRREAVYLVFIIIINLIFISWTFNVYAQDGIEPTSEIESSTIMNKFPAYISSELSQLMKKDVGVYFTVSSSGGSNATHMQLPFILRGLKPTGICTVVLIIYNSMDANTTIADRSGNIIEDVHGPHKLFAHGFGLISYNGSLFNSPLWYVGMSIIQPRIIE